MERINLIRSMFHSYTKLVFFNTMLLIAPNPTLNKIPPTRHNITFIIVESRGVIIGIMVNNSIPAQSEPTMESQVFCFAATLTSRSIATNTKIKKILAIIHMTIPLTPAVPVSKESPEIAPPSIVPMK